MVGGGVIIMILFIYFLSGLRVVNQFERRVVFTLGRYTTILEPGLKFIWPIFQSSYTVDIREKAVDIPSQEAMTKDNISCNVNAVIYYKIEEKRVERAVINVKNLDYAMTQFALTTMRNIVGQFELDQLLENREEASKRIKQIVDEKSDSRGVDVLSVELRDIALPDELKRTIGKQAEAERERRAKIISSEGEVKAAENLRKAAATLAEAPGALHLRTLESINDISSDQSNTTIWMIPMEVLDAIKGFGEKIKKEK